MLKISLLGLFFGTVGTTLGGIIGMFSKKSSNRFLSFVFSICIWINVSSCLF